MSVISLDSRRDPIARADAKIRFIESLPAPDPSDVPARLARAEEFFGAIEEWLDARKVVQKI
jgi:hypothetical protein